MPEVTVENQINPDKIGFLAPVDDKNKASFQLLVKDLKGKTLVIDIARDALIMNIKEQVADQTGLPVLAQRLAFENKELSDQTVIQDTPLQYQSVLELQARLKGGLGEYKAISAFIGAHIKHGNVRGLMDRDSKVAVSEIRNNRGKRFAREVYQGLEYSQLYQDESLQKLCARAMIVEGFGGGNCTEMAEWTAVKLIESTADQYVYVLGLVGNFTLKPDLVANANHPLWSANNQNLKNNLDHVMLLTYPEQADLADMDINKATILDPWYDNLVCSWADYMATKHPYYNYEYAVENALVLQKNNFYVKASHKTVGGPFAANDKKAAMKQTIANKKAQVFQQHGQQINENKEKFQFVIGDMTKDERSLENLEELLIQADAAQKAMDEIEEFGVDTFTTLLTSDKDEVLKILFTCIETENEEDLSADLYEALAGAPMAALDGFAKHCTANFVAAFFQEQGDEQALHTLLDNILQECAKKATLLKALSAEQFKNYTLNSSANFLAIVAINELKDNLVNCLQDQGMTKEHWDNFWEKCAKNAVKDIIKALLALHQATGQLALSKVPNDKVPVLE